MGSIRKHQTAVPDIAQWLGEETTAMSREQLVRRSSRRRLDAALESGSVVRLLPDVYAASTCARHPLVLGRAMRLWAPRGLVTGELALRLYLGDVTPLGQVDLVVENGDRMDAPEWVHVHQTGKPRTLAMPSDIHCTPPARAVLDAWRYAPCTKARELTYVALWARVCTWRELSHELDAAPRVAHRRELEGLLTDFSNGATSPLEVRARREVFTGAAFRAFEWQAAIVVSNRLARADLLHRAARLIVELDGRSFHDGSSKRRADRERDIELAAAGYLTIRLDWHDITSRPLWCRQRVLDVVAARTGQ